MRHYERRSGCVSFSHAEPTPPYRRLGILSLDSWRMLLRFKSFSLLVFVIVWADHGLRPLMKNHHTGLRLADLIGWTADLPNRIFEQLPAELGAALINPKAIVVLDTYSRFDLVRAEYADYFAHNR
jgi:hypothetical protein